MMKLMPEIMQKTADTVCEKQRCTAAERQARSPRP